MTTEHFAEALSDRFESGMKVIFGEMIIEHTLWNEAMELAFDKDDRIAFRASYALEWAYFKNRLLFVPYIDSFISVFTRVTNRSAHRHYTKMLCDIIILDVVKLSDEQEQLIAEKTFDILIDPKTKTAVKAWSMELLFQLSPRIDWVDEHFEEVIKQQMEVAPSPAMMNYTSKLLKRIAKRRKLNLKTSF